MATTRPRPLRWRIADHFGGPHGRRTIIGIGAGVLGLLWLVLVFRPYTGRPEIKEVGQTEVRCGAAYHALTTDFDRARASNSDPVRICAETGRARVFSASFFGGLILLLTLAAVWVQSGRRVKDRSASGVDRG
jgi:hypothetical protein